MTRTEPPLPRPSAPPPPRFPGAIGGLNYASPDLRDWRRPWVLPALAYLSVAFVTVTLIFGVRAFKDVLDLHDRAVPPPAPARPALAAPAVVPMPGDFAADAGLRAADRRRMVDAVGALAADLSPDRRATLDLLLSEIGGDLAGPGPVTPMGLARLSAARLDAGPDAKNLELPQPALNTLLIRGPGGGVELNDATATFTALDGRVTTLDHGLLTGPDGAQRWPALTIETFLADWAADAGVALTPVQAAQLYAAARAPSQGRAVLDGLRHVAGGTIAYSDRATRAETWVLPNGATVQNAAGRRRLDPTTGMAILPPPSPRAGMNWVPADRWLTAAIVGACATVFAWLALLLVPALGLLGDWRWARAGLFAWVAGRVALEGAAIFLLVLLTRQINAELAVRGLVPAESPWAALSRSLVFSLIAMLAPAVILVVLFLPNVRAYHARTGLRPSIPPALRSRLADVSEASWGRRALLALIAAAGLLAVGHAAITVAALAAGVGSVAGGIGGVAGLCLAGGIVAWAVGRLRTPAKPTGGRSTFAAAGLLLLLALPSATRAESPEPPVPDAPPATAINPFDKLLEALTADPDALEDPSATVRAKYLVRSLADKPEGVRWLLRAMRDELRPGLRAHLIGAMGARTSSGSARWEMKAPRLRPRRN